MKITSSAFAENAKIPKVYSKLGGNQCPPLAIDGVPADAKSLVIICPTLMRLAAMDSIIGQFGIYRPKPLKFLANRYPQAPSKGLPVGVGLAGADRNRRLAHTAINFTCMR